MAEIHAPGRLEHSLCGLAYDAFDSGDHSEPVVFAEPGQTVTCEMCHLEIDHVRTTFSGYRCKGNPKTTRPVRNAT